MIGLNITSHSSMDFCKEYWPKPASILSFLTEYLKPQMIQYTALIKQLCQSPSLVTLELTELSGDILLSLYLPFLNISRRGACSLSHRSSYENRRVAIELLTAAEAT